jgi:type IV pilus assembly protein PilB
MRRICDKCKVEASPNDLHLKLLKNHGLDLGNKKVFIGNGCEHCNNTGYKGRFAIHEVMPMWEEIQETMMERKSSFEMRQKAVALGLVTLQEQGFLKVAEGITSLDEWMRVVA